MSLPTQNNKKRLSTYELVVFAMLGTMMFLSKLLLEALPNIHMLGVLTMVYTLVYRKKALFPIYIFVLMTGIYAGFNLWWIPHLYLWTILWGITILLPQNMSEKKKRVVYPVVCALHGLFYGVLYAPAQAIMFGLSFKQMILWIIAGLRWDLVHAAGNFLIGVLIYPLSTLLPKISLKK